MNRLIKTFVILWFLLATDRWVLAGLESGAYQTMPAALVQESGDRVANGSRMMPWFATLIFDLRGNQPLLTAIVTNAVLEGGEPFTLKVHSSSGSKLTDGTYQFTGDYLGEINPAGSQYLFEWQFSSSTNGEVTWNGHTYWAGGHLWGVTLSNLTLVPAPWLTILPKGVGSAQITWSTNFADHRLESANSPEAKNWITVTNETKLGADGVSVMVDPGLANGFYRLRKPPLPGFGPLGL